MNLHWTHISPHAGNKCCSCVCPRVSLCFASFGSRAQLRQPSAVITQVGGWTYCTTPLTSIANVTLVSFSFLSLCCLSVCSGRALPYIDNNLRAAVDADTDPFSGYSSDMSPPLQQYVRAAGLRCLSDLMPHTGNRTSWFGHCQVQPVGLLLRLHFPCPDLFIYLVFYLFIYLYSL